MFCSNCGAQIREGSMFCGNCGQRVSNQVPPKKKTKWWLWVLIAIMILVVLGVGLFFLLNQKLKGEKGKWCMIKDTCFNSYGGIDSWHEYEYDENGNQIKVKHFDSNGTLESWIEKEYDTNSNQTKEAKYLNDGCIDYESWYEYDENGRRIKGTWSEYDGLIYSWDKYEYDAEGYLVKGTCFDSDGNTIFRYEYEYDKKGNLVKETCFDSDGNTVYRNEYEYDANDNKIKEIDSYPYENEEYWWEFQYDANGNLVKGTCFDDGRKITEWHEYEWQYIKYQVVNNNIFVNGDNDSKNESTSSAPEEIESSETNDPSTVPESLVQVKIDECLNKWDFSDCDSRDIEIIHDPDEASHMDSVTVVFKFRYRYGYIQVDYDIAYQYDRSSDLWSPLSGGHSSSSVVWDNIDCFVKSYEGEIPGFALWGVDGNTYYDVDIIDINTDNKTANIKMHVSYQVAPSGEMPYRDEEWFEGTIYIEEIAYFSDMKDNPNSRVISELKESNDDRALLKMTIDTGRQMTCWISLKRGLAIDTFDWWEPEDFTFIDGSY